MREYFPSERTRAERSVAITVLDPFSPVFHSIRFPNLQWSFDQKDSRNNDEATVSFHEGMGTKSRRSKATYVLVRAKDRDIFIFVPLGKLSVPCTSFRRLFRRFNPVLFYSVPRIILVYSWTRKRKIFGLPVGNENAGRSNEGEEVVKTRNNFHANLACPRQPMKIIFDEPGSFKTGVETSFSQGLKESWTTLPRG